ncbi:MAG: DUF2177 family protein [Polaromonas sp.]|nr:DUF2177 family protein [Polaromonas sp.]
MVVLDLLWLRVIAVQWYIDGMGALLTNSPNFAAAAAFYGLYPLGIVIFAVAPSQHSSVLKVAAMGALFGFFAYATYDLTALAVIKNWPVVLTFVDLAWGVVVSGLSAAAGKLAMDVFRTSRA